MKEKDFEACDVVQNISDVTLGKNLRCSPNIFMVGIFIVMLAQFAFYYFLLQLLFKILRFPVIGDAIKIGLLLIYHWKILNYSMFRTEREEKVKKQEEKMKIMKKEYNIKNEKKVKEI
jgi:hypothetical protein